ncbi:hypothetical protein F4814DRAFT_450163 [Daldinia grandis]|nr:hypothetical protein F4814DRAFT_450163 [Daldinia grandis]
MIPINKAAVLSEPKAHPLKIELAPYPIIGDREIIVKVAAAAINPMDWYIQTMGEQLVSTNAIQLPVASDYEVYTTASPKNLIEVFEGKTGAGAFAIQVSSEKIAFEIISKAQGARFVACAMESTNVPEGVQATIDLGKSGSISAKKILITLRE